MSVGAGQPPPRRIKDGLQSSVNKNDGSFCRAQLAAGPIVRACHRCQCGPVRQCVPALIPLAGAPRVLTRSTYLSAASRSVDRSHSVVRGIIPAIVIAVGVAGIPFEDRHSFIWNRLESPRHESVGGWSRSKLLLTSVAPSPLPSSIPNLDSAGQVQSLSRSLNSVSRSVVSSPESPEIWSSHALSQSGAHKKVPVARSLYDSSVLGSSGDGCRQARQT